MAGTIKADTIQSELGNPTVFKNSSGTEIGKLSRAWLYYNVTGSTVNGSFNVSGVVKNGTGDYTVSFSNAMNDGNYTWSHAVQYYASGTISGWQTITQSGTRSAGSIRHLTGSSASTVDCNHCDTTYTR